MTVTSPLRQAGSLPPFVSPETPALQAARLLAARGLAALPVLDSHRRLVGLVNARDLLGLAADRRAGLRGLSVEEVMRRDAPRLCPATSVEAALHLMESRGLHHLPVCTAEGVLLGLVSYPELARGEALPPASYRH